MSRKKKYSAIIFAIMAAALYAVSIPVSKVLLQSVSPTMAARTRTKSFTHTSIIIM